jgi:hypothetical protein
MHWAGLALFSAGCTAGLGAPSRGTQRPATFLAAYVTGLLFSVPVWLVGSPYAAVAVLTIAHGLQYLLLVGLIAGAPSTDRPLSLLTLINTALLLGLALSRMAHLHDGTALERTLFGIYLGLTAAQFVVDAGLWRLRDEFPRRFRAGRLSYLLAPERANS